MTIKTHNPHHASSENELWRGPGRRELLLGHRQVPDVPVPSRVVILGSAHAGRERLQVLEREVDLATVIETDHEEEVLERDGHLVQVVGVGLVLDEQPHQTVPGVHQDVGHVLLGQVFDCDVHVAPTRVVTLDGEVRRNRTGVGRVDG